LGKSFAGRIANPPAFTIDYKVSAELDLQSSSFANFYTTSLSWSFFIV
jgi:hypothetical protein